MANKDYYSILGVSKTASDDEIKSAYRNLAKKYHPDINKEEGAQDKFKEISEAYSVLSDKTKRANYDQFGTAEPQQGFGGGSGGFSGFGQGFEGGFEDIFNFFGGAFGRGKSAQQEQGADLATDITISFEEAAFGVEKEITIKRPEKCSECGGTGAKKGSDTVKCSDCNGSGKVQFVQNTLFGRVASMTECKTCGGTGKIIKEKCNYCRGTGLSQQDVKVKVKIPAGIDDGQTIRMRGEGEQVASANGVAGDLHINVKVKPHKLLVRKEFNLYVDVYVPFTILLLGGQMEIPTLKGNTTIDIKPLTQSNTKYTLKGKGIKFLRGFGSGDLVVTLKGEMPKSLDKNAKKLIKELESSISSADYPKTESYNKKLK
ncbi:MAG: molecular chaperone DnaJ [Clostridia bacterium]|nr:molecular chaperone DnaJ [Clostridia bacterium]